MSENKDFVIENGVLMKYNGPSGKVVVPEGVTEIGDNAFNHSDFRWSPNPTRIVLPEGVTRIGDRAFCGCELLEELVLPDSVEEIGEGAFFACEALRNIQIPEGVTVLKKETFASCAALASVTLPPALEQIGSQCFVSCGRLQKLVLPEGVTQLGWGAFSWCKTLKEISLPSTLEQIGSGCFAGCSKLRAFHVAPDSPYLCAEGAMLFNRDKTVLLSAPAAKGKFSVPKGVREIWEGACNFCEGITQLTVPGSVKKIDAWAFQGCGRMTKAVLEDGVEEIGLRAFSKCPELEEITLPRSVIQIHPKVFDEHPKLIYALSLPISAFSVESKPAAVLGFVQMYERQEKLPEKIVSQNLKYIRSQRRKLYSLAEENRPLLHLMLKERIISAEDLEELMEELEREQRMDTELKALLMDYQNQIQTPKQRERQGQKAMDLLESGGISVTEVKRNWRFETLEDGGIRIISYKGRGRYLTVPEQIGGQPVTEIGVEAFSPIAFHSVQFYRTEPEKERMRQIVSVILPEGVARIGLSAFSNCESLTRIQMPASVTKIDGVLNCPAVIYAPEGSYAQRYAQEYGIPFQAL